MVISLFAFIDDKNRNIIFLRMSVLSHKWSVIKTIKLPEPDQI